MTNQSNVLIVEDDPSIRENLETFLEDEGYQVKVANTGEDAVKLLNENQFDIGIIDIRLPGIDGNQVILDAHQKNPNMKFIIYTGYIEYQLPDALKQCGVSKQDIYFKPLPSMDKLLEAIDHRL